MEAEPANSDAQRSRWIAEPRVRSALRRFFERRAAASDVDDLVQTTLESALASRAPEDPREWDLWVYGIARHKLADHFRRQRPEASLEEGPEVAAQSSPQSARELLRWAERELPEGEHSKTTLEALLEEADGETLEHLARAQSVPPARLRQRVSRLREHFRARWARQLLLIGFTLGGVFLGAYVARILRQVPQAKDPQVEPPRPGPVLPTPVERAAELRRAALEKCRARAFEECLKGLDAAKALDPDGDMSSEVVENRAAAARALSPAPSSVPSARALPSPSAKPGPTSTATPPPRSTPPAPRRPKTTSESSLGSEPSPQK